MSFPWLRGRSKHAINYRHIIDWLVRKPGAFANYVYREELFPTSRLPSMISIRIRFLKNWWRQWLMLVASKSASVLRAGTLKCCES